MKKQILLILVCVFSLSMFAMNQKDSWFAKNDFSESQAIFALRRATKPGVQAMIELIKEGYALRDVFEASFNAQCTKESLSRKGQKEKIAQERLPTISEDKATVQIINTISSDDLGLVLFRILDADMIKSIKAIMKKADSALKNLKSANPGCWEKYEIYRKRGGRWPHSPRLRREIMEPNGFEFIPGIYRIDRMVCQFCQSEAYGLRETDCPNYYHKEICRFKPNAITDVKASFIQRIRYAIDNNSVYTRPDVPYCEDIKVFINFYEYLSLFRGLLQFAEFVQNGKTQEVFLAEKTLQAQGAYA